jgi:hypothetical protein
MAPAWMSGVDGSYSAFSVGAVLRFACCIGCGGFPVGVFGSSRGIVTLEWCYPLLSTDHCLDMVVYIACTVMCCRLWFGKDCILF